MNSNNYENLYNYYIQNLPIFMNIAQHIICQEPLDYFSYQRFYIGGRHLIFFTNQDYSKHFFDTITDLGKPFSERIKKSELDKINYYIWPINPDTSYFEGMFKYRIWNGLTINIRRSDYVDVYYFGTSKEILENMEMANFYISKIEFFKNYINFFNIKADSIINVRDHKILGKHTGQFILQQFEEKNLPDFSQEMKRHYVKINDRNTYFTIQEFKCLEILSKGYSTKFIAKSLQLSPRTVESYLQSVKYKTGFKSSDLLLDWFNKKITLENISWDFPSKNEH